MENHFRTSVFPEMNVPLERDKPFSFCIAGDLPHPTSLFQIFSASSHWGNEDTLTPFKHFVAVLMQVGDEPRSGIPKIMDWGITADQRPFIEWQFVRGESLERQLRSGAFLPLEDILNIIEDLSRTLAYCHNYDLVHGEVTAHNLLYDPEAEKFLLTGFGGSLFQPDQLIIDDCRNDIHAAGKLVYLLLTGEVLHVEEETTVNNILASGIIHRRQELLPSHLGIAEKEKELLVPEWLIQLLQKCFEKKPARSFQKGVELYDFILLSRLKKSKSLSSAALQISYKKPENKSISSRRANNPVEENRVRLPEKKSVRSINRKLPVIILFAVIVVGCGIIYLLRNQSNKKELPIAREQSIVAPSNTSLSSNTGTKQKQQSIQAASVQKTEKPVIAAHRSAVSKIIAKTVRISKTSVKKNDAAPYIHPWKPEGTTDDMHKGLGAYRVLSKAYFYNEPVETSRRNAFIVHWNNSVLKPMEEKNDFIYIVYHNIWGQTSKGWIRKKDLVAVNN
ncbi:MAG: hypothetical protein ACJ75B_14090 [Flavisolibacter sp.]